MEADRVMQISGFWKRKGIHMKIQWNPFLYREMKRYAGSRSFYVWLVVYEIFLALVTGVGYNVVLRTGWAHIMDYSGAAYLYFILSGILGLTVLVMVPSVAAGSIASEWENQTMELLLTTAVTPSQIVAGKLLASICMAILLVIAGVPFLAVSFILGGIQQKHVLEFVLLMIIEAVFIGSIGVCMSAFSRKTDGAGVRSYLVTLGVSIGTPLIAGVVYIIINAYRGSRYMAGQGGLGEIMLILLCNPVVTTASLLTDQMGYGNKFQEILCVLGPVPDFFLEHWCLISAVVQFMISLVLLFISARRIKKYYL